jgi:DNA-binding MarR family transcriptional regulator
MSKTPSAPLGIDCFCLQARMTARAVTRAYNAAMAPLGLEITEFSLLLAIDASSVDSISELADLLAFERTTLVRNLKRLEQRKLIAIADRKGRSLRYALTAKGHTLLADALPMWRKAQATLRRKLKAGDDATIHTSLRTLRHAAG